MAGFYEVTKSDKARKIYFRKVSVSSPTAIYLEDAAEAKLPAAITTMPFANLTTYDPLLVQSTVHAISYDADKGLSVISAVGQTQYSADGVTWANTIPNGVMIAGSPISFFIRTDPAALTRADDGTYSYNFLMAGVGSGGISLVNQSRNLAVIQGTTPLDQAGQTFSVNCTVVDQSGVPVTGTALTKVWA